MATQPMTIDHKKSAERIERDIETLAGPDYTRSSESIMRYAYTPEYRKTLDYLSATPLDGRVVAALEEAAEASRTWRCTRARLTTR